MAEAGIPGTSPPAPRRGVHAHRLEPGHSYLDLNHPENGPFVATGDEQVASDANIVALEELDKDTWEKLMSEGWGDVGPGAGDRAYDQGAFGQEDDPRLDVMNASPPGVGEGLTPKETEEEQPRR